MKANIHVRLETARIVLEAESSVDESDLKELEKFDGARVSIITSSKGPIAGRAQSAIITLK